ncbi:bifunctional aminoglycoside phosphotransferase/ATP-binding protein [Accumulibacter sp.]|uniref:bifunctional aminoglycoside phosphotransferase/ATP-binding protein n=1 Tax=Accumulibacter sp. TaxID=2053492 RepID=UPI0025E9563E|nr:bifunctional aminoglycoside phosphotransferase/ATP-binding protein [Accumulibacter sp.]MCM8612906.1 AAA family ATPase [Accumulibacter sp.]MCM8636635.1 AAA family ATPase [Accumulibacter sp.]MCM8638248.1 AAA family ATPase [Accumulibacter sp.]
MSPPLPPLISALLDPARYPHPAATVELIETHASWLLLAGDFAYKIKKPVVLPFLDYGTLERRRICCETELRLNRRFAPQLYLAVLPIVGDPSDPRIGGTGEVTEYAVRMRRFAEDGRLDRLCARGRLGRQRVSDLAATLATFHAMAAAPPADSPFGEPGQVLAPALANFDELRELLPGDQTAVRLTRLREWTQTEFDRLQSRFVARKADGRIRDCHGDLHLGNLVVIDGRVTLFDCIEFSEALRWIDVASEIAFTYIDLLDHRQPGLACWLLNEWLACSGDYEAVPLLRFYAVYRALVRSKVAAIRNRQDGADDGPAAGYLALAERLVVPTPPRLIITHGVAGCGKTRASRDLLLADAAAATIRLRSDVERKRLFGLAAAADSGSRLDGGIYSAAASERTYERLAELARGLLAAGWSVIVDAAFLERRRRAAFRQLASRSGAAFFIVAPAASPGQLVARIRGRLARRHDASEADLSVLARQLARVEELGDEEREELLPERHAGQGQARHRPLA